VSQPIPAPGGSHRHSEGQTGRARIPGFVKALSRAHREHVFWQTGRDLEIRDARVVVLIVRQNAESRVLA
jgi:hypothetical protein